MKRLLAGVALALALAPALAGCGAKQPAHEPVSIRVLAVLPLQTGAPDEAQRRTVREQPGAPVPPDAAAVVTAQIYRVLADQTAFRFVPDLAVAEALHAPAVRAASDLEARAVALGKQVGADGVLFGRVYRFRKRVGTDFGVTEPASVSFDLNLVAVATGEVLWQGAFDRTQEPLSANLLNWWMFWRAGPRWFTTAELAGLGAEQLFGEMQRAVEQREP